MTKDKFFVKAMAAAKASGHIWPEYAACEAALESSWGESKLARMANNLFGQKTGFSSREWPTISIPTREFIKGQFVTMDAKWAAFPSWEESFRERMELLQNKSAYATALQAITGEKFIEEVSKVWATDPNRGAKVLATYRANKDLIQEVMHDLV